ncbi:glycosyltransferase family 2 protein [Aestuariibaculum lutulentum]|uniref:Glycosyltransferase family 2 protein n=1 Tax=Aestuariibaculum lutulentum TaxID=2920935 RepID=A0ABS9RE79_9FLAO|nr:glycosyltransferase family 2 protein [Aestuariibaculum lutulentum]MCH4551245.1 glycosyltransferase family 2 protein [Aestuariibaculum lutulentum]
MILQIIILNYNSAKDTVVLYALLLEQALTNTLVLVIDNNSKTEDRLYLKQNIPVTNLRLLSKNGGYAAGNTVGIKEAIRNKIPYVLLLNPDIRLDSNCIKKLQEVLSKDDTIAAIGPRICFRDAREIIYSDGGLISLDAGCVTTHRHYNEPTNTVEKVVGAISCDYVNGSVFMFKTDVMEKIGFMRSDFFLYFEETEWCLRAKARGYKLLTLPNATAYHTSSEKGRLYYYYMTRNRLLLSRLYPDYYKKTRRVIWFAIKHDLKNALKQRRFPSTELCSRIYGFIAGNFKPLKR